MGAHAKAVELCDRAIANKHFRTLYPRDAAHVLDTLGRSLHRTGEVARAMACWSEALAVYDEHADHRADDLRRRLADVAANG
jgi:hypothetical protein